jgi:hypothetical protein
MPNNETPAADRTELGVMAAVLVILLFAMILPGSRELVFSAIVHAAQGVAIGGLWLTIHFPVTLPALAIAIGASTK